MADEGMSDEDLQEIRDSVNGPTWGCFHESEVRLLLEEVDRLRTQLVDLLERRLALEREMDGLRAEAEKFVMSLGLSSRVPASSLYGYNEFCSFLDALRSEEKAP